LAGNYRYNFTAAFVSRKNSIEQQQYSKYFDNNMQRKQIFVQIPSLPEGCRYLRCPVDQMRVKQANMKGLCINAWEEKEW
jgi:hypothetical protein